jgi:hypothetical protein
MMATEFVATLQALIAEHGDAPLYLHDDAHGALETKRIEVEAYPRLANATLLPAGFLVY